MNIADWIRKWSLLTPHHIALIDENTPITYNELNTRINRLSNFLLKIGLKKEDRVSVLLNNSHEFLEVFFAVSKIGAVFVPLNLRLSAPEIEYVINDCSAETLFLDPQFSEIIFSLQSSLPILKGILSAQDRNSLTLPNPMKRYLKKALLMNLCLHKKPLWNHHT